MESDLMLVHLAQLLWREPLLLKKLEHRRPAIMARKIIRRPRKSCRPRPIAHPGRCQCLAKIGGFAEPTP